MIRIPLLVSCSYRLGGSCRGGSCRASCGFLSRRSRRATYAGATGSLVHPLQLIEANCNVVLTHSEKAANALKGVFDLAGLIDNQLFNVTNFFIGIVVNIDANELGRSPLAILVHHRGSGSVRRGRCCGLRRGDACHQRRAEQCSGQIFRNHCVLQNCEPNQRACSVLVPSGERCRPKFLWLGLEQSVLEFGYRTQPSIRVGAAEISRGWEFYLGNQSSLADCSLPTVASQTVSGCQSALTAT